MKGGEGRIVLVSGSAGEKFRKEEGVMRRFVFLMSLLFLVFLVTGCMQETKRKVDAERLPKFAKGAKYVGSEACADCHDELVEKFKNNIHAKIADFETKPSMVAKGCEACHGPASRHIDEEDPSLIINPANLKPAQANAICLQCHSSGDLMDWHGSEHDLNNLSCLSCHTIHGEHKVADVRDKLGYRHKYPDEAEKYLLKKPEPELCFTCHKDVLAQTRYPNHHPIKEGKLVCSDCHNPHGSEVSPLLRTDENKNELCLRCHQDKSGPYTFEHAPVVEDCTICHNPHGSVADNLLKQNEPFLCIQCHGLHFHGSITPDTAWLQSHTQPCGKPGFAKNPSEETGDGCKPIVTVATPHAMQKIMTTKCTECHSAIHGSDLPSLAAPGGGSRLTR